MMTKTQKIAVEDLSELDKLDLSEFEGHGESIAVVEASPIEDRLREAELKAREARDVWRRAEDEVERLRLAAKESRKKEVLEHLRKAGFSVDEIVELMGYKLKDGQLISKVNLSMMRREAARARKSGSSPAIPPTFRDPKTGDTRTSRGAWFNWPPFKEVTTREEFAQFVIDSEPKTVERWWSDFQARSAKWS